MAEDTWQAARLIPNSGSAGQERGRPLTGHGVRWLRNGSSIWGQSCHTRRGASFAMRTAMSWSCRTS
jgi:hypothetical protein